MKLNPITTDLILQGEHLHLSCTDECYFTNVYECGECQSEIKKQIFSLKRCEPATIGEVAHKLTSALPAHWVENYTFVPMPRSSRSKNGIELALHQTILSDHRNLLVQVRKTPASHLGWRPSPMRRAEFLDLNESLVDPAPSTVVILDDVITTGAHFRAAKLVLRKRWPHLNVIGLFLARVCSLKRRCPATRTSKRFCMQYR
jgi:hypothetical protein